MSDSSSSHDVQTLYADHHRWLVAWLHKRLRCADSAADLAQDTFVRVLGRAAMVGEVREPRAWLATIANGLLIDRARRAVLEEAYQRALETLPEPVSPSPEEKWMMLELLDRVDRLLEGLKPRVRTAFLLSRLEGLPHKAIAAQMNVSRTSVEKYIATAMMHCYRLRYSWRDQND